jgi:uncharacterized membrane protein YhaH (DUF805 family)
MIGLSCMQQAVINTGRPANMMSFENAIRTVVEDKFFDFSGRASRSEYWWMQLGLIGLQIGMVIVFVIMGLILGEAGALLGMGVMVLLSLALFLPLLGVTVRRLHDGGRSGWWFLLALIPFVNFIGAWVILVFLIMDGQPGDNQYGPVPTNTR